MSQQVNVYRKLKMFPGAIVEGSFGPMFDMGGTTYYVNNITGSSTADGLSWNSAVDEVSTAVTLSEASRIVHPGASTNDYIRNTIVIQGTETEYTGDLTDLGEFTRIIGLSGGVEAPGIDVGVVRIGSSTTSGAEVSGMLRGNLFQNLVFTFGGDTKYGLYVTGNSLSCTFYGVDFLHTGVDGEACCHFQAVCANGVIERCTFDDNSGGTGALYGLYLNGQTSGMRIRDNVFSAGSTASLYLGSGSHQIGTVISGNYFPYISTVGILDESEDGYAMVAGNYFADGSVDLTRTTNTRTVGNMESGTTTFVSA